ncbi:hypothetical protein PTTG_00365 [Puccinia triticina 1-1 BBBD Race 1]|uniref:Secreted protein n=2 Tax=Puccinia triticina TaxID=208348 RepID=A0A180H007_PUCT1|nr:uncharacterized protein PtA15_8A457 [Puccinia triticina]OAV98320.1 hypothetical protein PTTG_00365 [Puccinia triticina 1-1 BBBD Race 1]WAQ87553.1 hypothetical protein PtA15_8A457 [Puccinia triticina]WAR57402.1 hypothetical protein PtB15_8B449 [Puccinia triticina]
MHHSFLTTALLIASNVFAQNNPTNTTSVNGPLSTQANANQAGAAAGPKTITLNCTDSLLPFSERDLAEMAQEDPSTGAKQNQALPDPQTLSTVQTAAICKSGPVTAICVLNTCPINEQSTYPVCQECNEYTPNEQGDDGTLGKDLIPSVTCDDSYNFNITDKFSHLCSTKAAKTFSCKTCYSARSCNTCYDVKDIPNDAAPAGTTATNSVPLNTNAGPNNAAPVTPPTTPTTTPPTTTPPTN